MRFATFFAASVVAAALFGGSPTLAADARHIYLAQDGSTGESVSADSLNAQDQDFADSTVYGVRGRSADALASGSGSYHGGVDLTATTGIDENGDLTFSSEHVSLSSTTPGTDLEAGYVSSYLNGALSRQANAAYQMNVNGRSGTNAVTLLSRVKLTF